MELFLPKSLAQIKKDLKGLEPFEIYQHIPIIIESSINSYNKLKIIKGILDYCDRNYNNEALIAAVVKSENRILRFLINKGVFIKNKFLEHGGTSEVLWNAAYSENVEAINIMLQEGYITVKDIIQLYRDSVSNNVIDILKKFLPKEINESKNSAVFVPNRKRMNESMSSILKPKSEEEIENVLSEMEGDELYELWFGSLNPEYLKRALKKGYQLSSDELEHAMTMGSDTNIGKETIDLMMPAIMKNFPLGISKTGSDNYTIKADDWGDFVFLFHEDRDVSRDGIQSILDGTLDAQVDVEDVLDFRFTLEKYDADHDTSYVVSQIKEAALLEANEVGLDNDDVQLIHKQSNLYGIISVIRGLKDELKNTHMALRHTLSEVLTVSATDEMFESVLNSIKNYLDAKEVKVNENGISMLVSQGTVTKIFRASIGDSDGELQYSYPYYGFSGDPEKYFDVFVDALENRLSDLK